MSDQVSRGDRKRSRPKGLSPTNCPHWKHIPAKEVKFFLQHPKFQSLYQQNRLFCHDCDEFVPLKHLWVCLLCNHGPHFRCGRYINRHTHAHVRSTSHCLFLNLDCRMIWCYLCENRIANTDEDIAVTPQLIRSWLDPPSEDANRNEKHVNSHRDTKGRDTEGNDTKEKNSKVEQDNYLDYYVNPYGGLAGLVNLGNTCYLNSALQALLHCPPLIAFFVGDMDESKLVSSRHRRALCLDFHDLVRAVWGASHKSHTQVFKPIQIVKDIWSLNPFFRGFAQHDTQEFTRCILDNLHEGMVVPCQYNYNHAHDEIQQLDAKAAKITTETKEADKKQMEEKLKEIEEEKERVKRSWLDNSIVADIFRGEIISNIRCLSCGHVSKKLDPYYDLSVDMPKGSKINKIKDERGQEALTPNNNQGYFSSLLNYIGVTSAPLSVETCLHSFCTGEELVNQEQYLCSNCKQKVDAKKTLAIAKLPEVLCIHVKRFTHGSYFNKITRHVMFPLQGLDMKQFLEPGVHDPRNGNPANPDYCKYDLFATIKHSGSASMGHYIAYAKHHINKKWYKFDDRSVTRVNEDSVEKSEIYVAFYKRRPDTVAIREAIERIRRAENELIDMDIKKMYDNGELRFLSRLWVKKVQMFSLIEPIDNRSLCCRHGVSKMIPAESDETAIAISKTHWDKLLKAYGGGPEVDGKESICEPCQLPVRRAREKKMAYACDHNAMNNWGDTPYYLLSNRWLSNWKKFTNGDTDNDPGPISNIDLFLENDEGSTNELNETKLTPRPNLQKGRDYIAIHHSLWDLFHDIYGGGPTIIRKTVDVYAPAVSNDWKAVGIGEAQDENDDQTHEQQQVSEDSTQEDQVPSQDKLQQRTEDHKTDQNELQVREDPRTIHIEQGQEQDEQELE